jgi:type I restriction enzyme S subunit
LPKISNEKATALQRHRLRPGDILFARRGVQATGRSAIVREHEAGFVCGTGAIRLRLELSASPVLPEFLSLILSDRASIEWFKFHAIGATMPNLNEGIIKAFSFASPPLAEQVAITSILGALDDKIDLNRRMNETLEAMARAIFKDWFVDFGPTRAKMEGRPPYLAPDLWALFPDRLDEEGTPEGWKDGDLSSVVSLIRTAISPSQYPDEIFEHHSLPSYDAGQRPVSETGSKILSNKTIVPPGAVLLSKLNPEIARVWLADVGSERQAIASTEFLVLQPSSPDWRAFIYCCVSEIGFRKRLEAMVSGTSKSHQRVSPSAVLALSFVLPPAEMTTSFGKLAGALLDQVLGNRREAVSLGETRDLLLPKLMSGEVRVREAQKVVEAVL